MHNGCPHSITPNCATTPTSISSTAPPIPGKLSAEKPSSRKNGTTAAVEQKQPRIRTVLTEQQLQTLRSVYQTNPRPDALLKEQLCELTGLSARVIRVWFQNRRCKDKKALQKAEAAARLQSSGGKVCCIIEKILKELRGASSPTQCFCLLDDFSTHLQTFNAILTPNNSSHPCMSPCLMSFS